MHNFDKAALGNTTREKACGALLKALCFFLDILDDMDKGHLPTESHIDEN
jgi:hypothetical protein